MRCGKNSGVAHRYSTAALHHPSAHILASAALLHCRRSSVALVVLGHAQRLGKVPERHEPWLRSELCELNAKSIRLGGIRLQLWFGSFYLGAEIRLWPASSA